MKYQNKKESKAMPALLKYVRKVAIVNAGIPSLRGTYENEVPKNLKK